MNDLIYSQYGGKIGSFSREQLDAAYHIAEQQTSNYIGTLLLPTVVTGTFTNVNTTTKRIATDYGYVSQIFGVIVKTQKVTLEGGCELLDLKGGAFIYEDTFGYIDVYKLQTVYGIGNPYPYSGYAPSLSNIPYQYQVVYEAGLPTGTANLPSMLAAMTIATTITLNELYPGIVGMNESVGDAGIQEYESFGYRERRTAHSLKRTAFGQSAMATKASQLVDSCIKKARRTLQVG